MELLGGECREALTQVETHLIAERAERSCSCAIAFANAVVLDMAEQIKVLLHGVLC